MNKGVALGGLLLLTLILVAGTLSMRDFGTPMHKEMDDYFLTHGQIETGANNIVTSVVFDYRGFDTLGEATVLFSAVSGVLVIFRRTAAMDTVKDVGKFLKCTMSSVVTTQANIIFGLTTVFGIYIIVHGHLTPGGGFQGGAVIASAVALLIVSYGFEKIFRNVSTKNLGLYESIGLLTFITMALLGVGHTFFYNFLAKGGVIFGDPVKFGSNPGNLNTAGVLPIMSMAVGLEVIAGLSLIMLYMYSGLRSRKIDRKEGDE